MKSKVAGTVYLVGAGPGAPALITLRGAELLRRADVVLYDALVDPRTLREYTKGQCFSVGKRAGGRSVRQETIHRLMIRAARAGKTVVRLGLTWNDRISFVLTEQYHIKRVTFRDILRRESDAQVQDEKEQFEIDFALMTGELARLLDDLLRREQPVARQRDHVGAARHAGEGVHEVAAVGDRQHPGRNGHGGGNVRARM